MRDRSNNDVKLVGTIVEDYKYEYQRCNESFYSTKVAVKRRSGVEDIIPIQVSDRIADVGVSDIGRRVYVEGSLRTRNTYSQEVGHKKCQMYVFIDAMSDASEDEAEDINDIIIHGYICKQPILRQTPGRDRNNSSRRICDLLVAANRTYGKSDYIPMIAWGRNAAYASQFSVGDEIEIDGRLQSREYKKKIGEDEYKTMTAYEVSITNICKFEDTDSGDN